MVTAYVPAMAAAYLLGAIPFGFLVARTKGVDNRTVGSRNIGATNVARCLGRKWGYVTFACDFLKGFLPAALFPVAASALGAPADPHSLAVACGCTSVAGHNWPVFLRFKGGKGVATSAGALLAIAPLAVIVGLAAWFLVFKTTRFVSLASIIAAVAISCAAWLLHALRLTSSGLIVPSALTLLAALSIWRHRANIDRLRKGTESRFGDPPDQARAEPPGPDAGGAPK